MVENTPSLYSLPSTPSADRGAGPAAATSEVKRGDGDVLVLKEKEASRERSRKADMEVDVQVEMAAIEHEGGPAAAGKW